MLFAIPLLVACLGTQTARADYVVAPDEVDPKSVVSPNGQFRVNIDPDHSDARTGASYKFWRNGVLVWEKHLPFALTLAEVTDKGELCGTATTTSAKSRWAMYHATILDRRGRVRLHHRQSWSDASFRPRRFGQTPSMITTSSKADLFLIDLYTTESKITAYRISTGKLVSSPLANTTTFGTQPRMRRFVPGTNLLLVQTVTEQDYYNTPEFALYTPSGKKLWSTIFKQDYLVADEDSPEAYAASELRNGGAILSLADHAFRVRELKSGLDRRFNLVARNGSYAVEEGDSTKPIKPSLPVVPQREATKLPSIKLESPDKPSISPIGLITEFCVIAPGKFAHVNPRNNALVVFDKAGKVEKEISLAKTNQTKWGRIVYTGNDTVVLSADSGPNQRDRDYWKIKLSTGKTELIFTFPRFYENSLASKGDGTFVILGDRNITQTSSEVVSVRDLNGKELVKIGDEIGYGGGPSEFLGIEGVAVLKDGTIAVLSNIEDTIQFFSAKGGYLRTWDLKRLWGVEPSYPTEIREGPAGEILIVDTTDTNLLWIMDRNGKVIAKPKPDSVPAEFDVADVAWTSAGLFVSDSKMIYKITPKGEVINRIGEPESPQALNEVGDVEFLADGTIFATDGRSGRIHIFDKGGKWLGSRPPRSRGKYEPHDVWAVSPTECAFYSDNTRVTTIDQQLRTRTRPGKARMYKERDRRPDRTWFRWKSQKSFSLDGSYVVGDIGGRYSRDLAVVCGYSADGKPKFMFYLHLPEGESLGQPAFDGSRVWASLGNYAYCFDTKGKALFKVPLSRGGELAIAGGILNVYSEGNQIDRYVLPP